MQLAEVVKLGAKPTPSILKPLIVAILEEFGPQSKGDIVLRLSDNWKKVGGPPIDTFPGHVKRALRMLQDEGIASNPMRGVWKLQDSEIPFGSPFANSDQSDNPEDINQEDESEDQDESEFPNTSIELEIGRGEQFVYVFYLPTFRRVAEASGQDFWPIKIGMTTTNVRSRIETFRTALPEEPVVALVIRTENAALLERILHGVLTYRGRRVETGGSEWFGTSVEEILDVYRFAESSG